jgi:hypothetical protein
MSLLFGEQLHGTFPILIVVAGFELAITRTKRLCAAYPSIMGLSCFVFGYCEALVAVAKLLQKHLLPSPLAGVSSLAPLMSLDDSRVLEELIAPILNPRCPIFELQT